MMERPNLLFQTNLLPQLAVAALFFQASNGNHEATTSSSSSNNNSSSASSTTSSSLFFVLNNNEAVQSVAASSSSSRLSSSSSSSSSSNILRFPQSFETDFKAVIEYISYSTIEIPKSGGGGGISLILDGKYFIKFNRSARVSKKELLGNTIFYLLGERVPETRIIPLNSQEVKNICQQAKEMDLKNEDGEISSQILRQLEDKESMDAIVMPLVEAVDFNETHINRFLLKEFFQNEENIYKFAFEIGKIAVKDFVTQVGDRILGTPNFGNIMLLRDSNEDKLDITQGLIVIDNIIKFSFNNSMLNEKLSKEEFQKLFKKPINDFIHFGSTRYLKTKDLDQLYKLTEKGIQQGLEDLKSYISRVNDSILIDAETKNMILKNKDILFKNLS